MEEKNTNPKKFKLFSGLLIGLGCLLILLSLLLVLHNYLESQRALEGSMADLSLVQQEIEKGREASTEPTEHLNPYDLQAEEESKEMTVKTINGNDYIGYLSIPGWELELPVISQWSYPRLQIAPCRQWGSTKSDDLVIAAHNYPTHFGHLREMHPGDDLYFTDMDGEKIGYTIDSVGVIDPTSGEMVKNSGYDLVLYTCTFGGANRVMVGCYRQTTEAQ